MAVAFTLLSLFGCSGRNVSPVQELTLRIGVPAPQGATGDVGLQNVVDSLTMESLVVNLGDGRTGERLATAWSWNADRTVLHLDLREGVSFHDGTPLTPDIVVEALRKAVADQRGSSLSKVTRIEAAGKGVDIILSSPDSFLLGDLADTSIRRPGVPTIGTGPYKLTTSKPVASLVAFNQYYKGLPSIRAVTISSYPTQRSAWAALMRADINMLQEVSQDAIDFVEAESTVRTYSFPKPYYYVLAFNVRNPVLVNTEVRRAINEGVDKDAVVKDGLHGRAQKAVDPIWPDFWALASQQKEVRFNPESANERLERAGYAWQAGDAIHPPSRVRLNCLVWADDSRLVRVALLLQKQLIRIGVDLRLEPLPFNTLVSRIGSKQFDMFLFEMANARTLSWVYRFWHSPSSEMRTMNYTGYTGADATLDSIRAAASDEEIRKLTAELRDVFAQDPPAVFLAWQTLTRAVSADFVVPPAPGRDIMSSIWQWKPADGRQFAER